MKKIMIAVLAIVLCVGCVLACVACNNNETLVCGVTVSKPMNWKDDNGNWTGFDTEFAQAVAKELKMKIKFQEIDWGQKYTELNTGTISCIWNGFTANCADSDGIQRSDKVDMSYFYMNNEQCVVTKKANVATITSAESLAGKKAGVESGSAGAAYAKSAGANITVSKPSQISTLVDLNAGSIDFVVMDKTLAKSVVGKGDNQDIAIVEAIQIAGEKYAIGFKKGSPLKDKVNEAMVKLAKDGTLQRLAEKYEVANVLDLEFAEGK